MALAVTITVVLLRFGLLAIVVMILTMGVMAQLPVTLSPSSWFFHNVWLVGTVLVGLAAWGMRAALAGRPLLSADS